MNMMGIVFSNIYDEQLGEITSRRTLASLPFGGRYRLVDFVLSNMVNANITNVGVITKQNYQSLMDHLGSGKEWDLDRKVDGLFILPPFGSGQKSIYRGRLEALWGTRRFLERSNEEYVLLADTHIICNMDYQDMLKEHVQSGADISIITKRENITGRDDARDLIVRSGLDGRVKEVLMHYGVPGVEDCGIGMYILKRTFLLTLLQEAHSYHLVDFEREILQAKCNLINIHSIHFHGQTLCVDSIGRYFNANMALLNAQVREEIFFSHGPIYTKILDEVPTRYATGCKVTNSLLADGCTIRGCVENSILFRGVKVGSGAKIKNCILMQDTKIEDNVELHYTICDKDVTITKGRLLVGAPGHQIVIAKNKVV
ncbi:MAG: glucose-1-phosphate adenylyltransferase subunit GlgD [Ruminococcaceae bacterium]|nr:glucose-1-phosphate adenylyltransferase subunit GlgD [Oscillospiraceae bacterium]